MKSPNSHLPSSSTASAPPPGAPIFDCRDRVVVLTPCYGGQITDVYHNALQACLQATAYFRQADGTVELMPIIADRISLVSESHIDRGRNTLTNLWVERAEKQNGPRKALWWDADVEIPPTHLLRMYLHSAYRKLPFVCAPYASKTIRPSFVVNCKAGTKPDPETGLIEVLHAGTGAMLWDISVPYKLREHARVVPYACAPNSPWPNQKHYAYFTSGPYGAAATDALPQWQSEDWMVCMLWQELGGKVFLDTEAKLRHHGSQTFPPDIGEIQGALEAMLAQNHPAVNRASLIKALGLETETRPLAA